MKKMRVKNQHPRFALLGPAASLLKVPGYWSRCGIKFLNVHKIGYHQNSAQRLQHTAGKEVVVVSRGGGWHYTDPREALSNCIIQ